MTNQSGSGGQGNDPPNKKGGNPNISDMILGGLKPRAGKETSSWLSNLGGSKEAVKDAIEQEVVAARPISGNISGKGSVIGWFDKIFDNFTQYEVEFNRAVQGTELAVSTERPEYLDPEAFRGRLSTRDWTLILRHNKGLIEGFFVPCDKMIGFSINERGFTRILHMKPGHVDAEPCFLVGDKQTPVLFSQIPYFAKQLFGALIRVAKGEGSDQEDFIWMPPSALPERNPGSGDYNSERTADSVMRTVKPAMSKEELQQGLPSQRPAAAAAAAAASPAPVAPVTPASVGQSGAYVHPRPQLGGDGTPMTLSEAFDQVLRSMEFELENLSQTGSRAFEEKDQARVDAVMKRQNKVKAYRERLRGAITEWKTILSSDD